MQNLNNAYEIEINGNSFIVRIFTKSLEATLVLSLPNSNLLTLGKQPITHSLTYDSSEINENDKSLSFVLTEKEIKLMKEKYQNFFKEIDGTFQMINECRS